MKRYAPDYGQINMPLGSSQNDETLPLWFTACLQIHEHNRSLWKEFTGKQNVFIVSDTKTGFNPQTGKHYASMVTYDEKGNVKKSKYIESLSPLKGGQIRVAFSGKD